MIFCEESFHSSVVVFSGDQGSPLQKHPKLEARLSGASLSSSSSKTMSLTPPPVLPPKTRKLVSGGQAGAGAGSSGAAQQTAQQASSSGNNTTKRQHQLQPSTSSHSSHSSSLESEERILPQERVSVVRIGAVPTSLSRSLSSVAATGTRLRTRVAKPVRRSKSQLTGGKYVTNITHGGSVTLVSLNSQEEAEAGSRFQPLEGAEGGPASAVR